VSVGLRLCPELGNGLWPAIGLGINHSGVATRGRRITVQVPGANDTITTARVAEGMSANSEKKGTG
jgi:hypothetical protein